MHCDKVQGLLGAYRDGELLPEERRAVAAHLEGCASCSGYLADLDRMGRAIDGLGRTPAPPSLAGRIGRMLDRMDAPPAAAPALFSFMTATRRKQLALQAAALVVACLASALATWWAVDAFRANDRLEHDIVSAHIRSLIQEHPVQVASSDQHTVKPWFAGRTDFAPEVKQLADHGFPLIGGRLDYAGDRRVGVVVYMRRLHTINVFMWRADTVGEAAPRIAMHNGYTLLSWTRAGITYCAVSDLNAEEMRELQRLL
jgi:anti-sigma factor RsiW